LSVSDSNPAIVIENRTEVERNSRHDKFLKHALSGPKMAANPERRPSEAIMRLHPASSYRRHLVFLVEARFDLDRLGHGRKLDQQVDQLLLAEIERAYVHAQIIKVGARLAPKNARH